MDNGIIATVKATKADAAELRYRIAVKLRRLMVANRIAGQADTWIVRASERGE